MRQHLVRAVFGVGLVLSLLASPALAQTLGIQGTRFTVDGQQRFLTFVSLFDAVREANGDLQQDLNYIQSHHYDGIRIFPTWWGQYGCGQGLPAAGTDGLFVADGGSTANGSTVVINSAAWSRFINVLNAASARGMLVDVSFSVESIAPGNVDPASFGARIADVEDLIKGQYRNVFFDLQNEFNDHFPGTDADRKERVRLIAEAVRAKDDAVGAPRRLLMASTTDGNYTLAGQVAAYANLDIVGLHPTRTTHYQNDVAYEIATALANASGSRPVYVQEPMPLTRFNPGSCGTGVDPDPDHAREAVVATYQSWEQEAGGAAYTLHSRSSFDLKGGPYQGRMSSNEVTALENLHGESAGNYRYDVNGYCNFLPGAIAASCSPTGRWKINGGQCEFVSNESGPNQCVLGRYKYIDAGLTCRWDPYDYGGDQCQPTNGRKKLDGARCYWDPTDSGPDQCSELTQDPPPPPPGRFKFDGAGNCYWEQNDDGPDQCQP